MKLTCPACSAEYTIATERLMGRRVKVRCKRCGDSFPVDASLPSGEVCARRSENRRGRDADLFAGAAAAGAETSETTSAIAHATPLTGERNESSVLFSLAALSRQAPTPSAPTVTESSALIDIRALVSAGRKAEASTACGDDIMNLSGGGAFAPLFAPPVTFAPSESEEATRRGHGPIAIGAIAFAVVAMVSIATFAAVRSSSSASTSRVGAPVEAPSVAVTASRVALPATANEEPPASSTPIAGITPVRAGTTASVAPPARSAAHANDSRTVATQASAARPVPTASAAPKCCPGESEMACHMRVAAGAMCSAEPTGPTVTSAPPFDRAAALHALGIDVASCKRGASPSGAGHVKVTFQPSGAVSSVEVDAPYAGTATGSCVAQRFRTATVPAFAGAPLSVGKTFMIE